MALQSCVISRAFMKAAFAAASLMAMPAFGQTLVFQTPACTTDANKALTCTAEAPVPTMKAGEGVNVTGEALNASGAVIETWTGVAVPPQCSGMTFRFMQFHGPNARFSVSLTCPASISPASIRFNASVSASN
jgi:hypothetical protein